MVTQNTFLKCEGISFLSIEFATSVAVNKCLEQVKLVTSVYTYAPTGWPRSYRKYLIQVPWLTSSVWLWFRVDKGVSLAGYDLVTKSKHIISNLISNPDSAKWIIITHFTLYSIQLPIFFFRHSFVSFFYPWSIFFWI